MLQARKRTLEFLGFATVMAITVISRLWNLGYPSKLVFDETYYVKDALTLSREGHEMSWPDNANPAFEAGNLFGYLPEASFAVHPPFGKWLIASGMWLVGPDQSFGWRLSTAILGIATVALLMLVALKLFRSAWMAITAGLLLSIDGLAITMSRTALLDGSLTFFLVLGFYFFLLDQNQSRLKILRALESGNSTILRLRPWLILSGVSLGLATSIKWSGLYLLAGIGIYVVVSEGVLRKNSGESGWAFRAIGLQGAFSFLNLVPIAIASYLSTWLGWIWSTTGYGRSWASQNELGAPWNLLPDWLQSLWKHHEAIYRFHVNLTTDHPYEASPIGWLIGFRPTAFFYESYEFGQNGCQIEAGCSSAITSLGNPLIWITATIALAFILLRYLRHRERVLGLVLLGFASVYLPWLIFAERTVFQFYAVSFQPWMILALVLVLQQLRTKIRARSEFLANLAVISFLVLAFALSAFFLPINTGMFLPFEMWQWRMWLPSWV